MKLHFQITKPFLFFVAIFCITLKNDGFITKAFNISQKIKLFTSKHFTHPDCLFKNT